MRFKNRCVSDLAWMISSPPLVSGEHDEVHWLNSEFFRREYELCLPYLENLDNNPSHFIDTIETHQFNRLGIYFELLTQWWIKASPHYDLIARNVAIRKDGITLGELDFVIKEIATDKLLHLEVAVKFYLGYGSQKSMGDFHGPNLHDRLDKKFSRLLTHQTVLSRNYPDLIPWAIDESHCILKGRLFYPAENNQMPEGVAADHLRGQWLYEKPRQHPTRVLSKHEWLAASDYSSSLVDSSYMIREPRCYAAYSGEKEVNRYFLLAEGFWQRLNTDEL